MWRGDSVVLKVAVRILPEIGFREVMVGVIFGGGDEGDTCVVVWSFCWVGTVEN